MHKAQQKRFDSLCQQHLNALQRQGKSHAIIDAYSRAVRCIAQYFDRYPTSHCVPCENSGLPCETAPGRFLRTKTRSTLQGYTPCGFRRYAKII